MRVWKANFNHPALNLCPQSPVMMFMLERDFRDVLCCCARVLALGRSGAGLWTAWMGRGWRCKEALQEPGSLGRLGEHQCLHVALLGWREDGPRLCSEEHGKSWLGTRGNKIPEKIIKHWSRESGSPTSLVVWDLDTTRPWATWSGGICAEEEAGLTSRGAFQPKLFWF